MTVTKIQCKFLCIDGFVIEAVCLPFAVVRIISDMSCDINTLTLDRFLILKIIIRSHNIINNDTILYDFLLMFNSKVV